MFPKTAGFISLLTTFISLQIGCEYKKHEIFIAHAKSFEQSSQSNSHTIKLDGGIIFENMESYICVPLSRIGLKDNDKVTSVTSTCDCVAPSIVKYLGSAGQSCEALFLSIISERSENSKANQVAISLEITIDIKLESGLEQQVSVPLTIAQNRENKS